jgi:hypothetical protein
MTSGEHLLKNNNELLMKRTSVCTLLACLLALASGAQARVTRFVIEQRQAYAGGQSWGTAGPYEHIVGRAYFEVDPANPHNAVIFNLDKAPRNVRGMVEFSAPVFILKPVNVALGNGKIFYNVNNRGNSDLGFVSDASKVGRHVLEQLKKGYSLVDAGWHGDGVPNARQLFPQFPVATQADGQPIVGPLRLEFFGGTMLGASPFSRPFVSGFRPYETSDTDTTHSTLTQRERADSARMPVPADAWAFGNCPTGRDSLKPTTTDICLFEGFSPDRLYELIYPAKSPIVMGLGYAVTRDVGSFFRNQLQDDAGTPNPLAPTGASTPARLEYGYGASSTGMYMRDFLYLGFNEDENGRKVFDGVFIHTGGAPRLFANVEFSHPTFYSAQDGHTDYLSNAQPPFTYGISVDPVSGVTEGILKRPKTDPLLIEVVDENSFWAWKNSLQVVDGHGRSVKVPENVRLYFTPGSGHLGIYGLLNPRTNPHGFAGECKYSAPYFSITGAGGPSAAGIGGVAMNALDEWVDKKITPPASNFPTRAEGQLVTLAEYRKLFPKIPGVEPPEVMAELDVLDFGPDFGTTGGRLTIQPPRHGAPYALFVPKPDKDGMAMADARSMEVSAPLGTSVGWNLRDAGHREDDLCGLEGSFFPFAKSKAERLAMHDPRLSLEERYHDHAGFVAAVKKAAQQLVRARLMLPEDVTVWVAAAEKSDVLRSDATNSSALH